jgi:hypothetical protein
MPAKRIAAMGRSYRYPQADRRNCPPFAAPQRGVEDGAATPTGNHTDRKAGNLPIVAN